MEMNRKLKLALCMGSKCKKNDNKRRLMAAFLVVYLIVTSCPTQVYAAEVPDDFSAAALRTVSDGDADAGPSTVSDADAGPSTVSDADAGPSTVSDADAGPSTVSDADAGSTTVSNADAEPSTVSDADAGPSTVSDADAQIEVDTEAEFDEEDMDAPAGTVPFRYDESSRRYSAYVTGKSGIQLQVSYEKGVFPEGAVLDAFEITNKSAIKKIKDSLIGEDENKDSNLESISFDIKILTYCDGIWTETQPDTSVGYPEITFTGDKIAESVRGEAHSIQVFHMADSVEDILASEENLQPQELQVEFPGQNTETISFFASHFSSYTILLSTRAGTSITLGGIFTGTNTAGNFTIDGNSTSTYDVTINIKASELQNPDLVITIPKGIDLTYYPGSNHATLSQYLRAGSSSVTKTTDSSGITVLTYQLVSNTSELGFNITLRPTFALKNGTAYSVKAELKSSNAQTVSGSYSVTMNNLSVGTDAVNIYYNSREITLDESAFYIVNPNVYLSTFTAHYPFDSIEAVIPVPAGAEPGYYNDSGSFISLSDKSIRTFTNGSVTYYSSWTSYESTSKSGAILVFKLGNSHPLVTGNSSSYSISDSSMGGIYYRFSKTNIDNKMGSAKSCIFTTSYAGTGTVTIDGSKKSISSYYAAAASITFKIYDLSDYFKLSGSLTGTLVSSGSTVLKLENNSRYTSNISNTTGEQISDIIVEYTLDPDLYANRVAASLSSISAPRLPESTVIRYKTKNGGDTIFRKELTQADNELVLEDKTDAIIWMEVIYNKLGTGSSTNNLLYIYVINREEKDKSNVPIKGQIISAKASVKLVGGDGTIGKQTEASGYYTLAKQYSIAPSGYLYKTTLNKGDSFTFSFYSSSSSSSCYVDNPVYYILMPKGYIYGGYTQPAEYSGEPAVSTREIKVDAEDSAALGKDGNGKYYVPEGEYVLYTIAYTGNNLKSNALHKMQFTVGVEVDTSIYSTNVYLPSLYLTTQNNEMFPYYNNNYYQKQDILDFNQNGNTTETLAKPYSITPATINAVQAISIQAFVTSKYNGEGESKSKDYQYKTPGTYEYYLYNGLGSDGSATNIEIVIALSRKGTKIDFGGKSYTSEWDAVLTGEPDFEGTVFEGAETVYSNDGGNSYNYDPAQEGNSYEEVTHVKVTSAEGKKLEKNKSAKISLPFNAVFGDSITSALSKAYMNANTSYLLEDAVSRSSIPVEPCTLGAAAVPISGYVYKDYNGDSNHDTDGKAYKVSLYEEQYPFQTEGLTAKASTYTASATGSYTNSSIYAPGYYTLQVEKALEETFLASDAWSIEGNSAYYSFQITGEQSKIEWIIYIIKPRTLSVSGFSSGAYLYNTESPSPTITAAPEPALAEGEKVTFTSSDTKVVTIDENGELCYVGEGDAVITVSVPQLPAFIESYGELVEEKINVKARKFDNSIILHTEKGSIGSDDFTKQSDGEFIGSYVVGIGYTLPAPVITSGEEIYHFAGWYDNEEKTGSRVTEITDKDYGDKIYWAKWVPYEVMYETSADNWVYGFFAEAVDEVYDRGRIKFLSDITLSSDVEIEKTIILMTDGDAKTIQCNEYRFNIVNNGALIMKDDRLTLTGKNEYGVLSVSDSTARAAIYKGTIENTGYGYAVYNCGILKLSGEPSLTGTPDICLSGDGKLDIVRELTNTHSYTVKVEDDFPGATLSTVSEKDYSDCFTSCNNGYRIGFSSEKKLILQKIIIIAPDSDQAKVYEAAEPEFTYQMSENVDVSGRLRRIEGDDVGFYGYTLGTLTAGENYYMLLEDFKGFSIEPRTITVKPIDMERKVGEENPDFKLGQAAVSDGPSDVMRKFSGPSRMFAVPQNGEIGEDITGVPLLKCDADADSPEGTYSITIISLKGTSSNYQVVYEGESSIGTLTVTQDSIVAGDYLIEPAGYVPGTWINESIYVKPQGAYTKIRSVDSVTGEKGEWQDKLTVVDAEVMQVFELKTETGAYTKTLEEALSLKSDTVAPYISNLTETADSDTGKTTVKLNLLDDLSGVDIKQVTLRQGEDDISFTLSVIENGYQLSFIKENIQDCMLEIRDMAGNVFKTSIELARIIVAEVVKEAEEEAVEVQPEQERKLDKVPKTGHVSNSAAHEMPDMVMWIDTKGEKVCRKKEKQD